MAIVFPPGVDGATYTVGGVIYIFEDGAWRLSAENGSSQYVRVDVNPPDDPVNGQLWFHSGEADLKIYYVDPTSSQWVPASSPPDPYEENFVSVQGDTMFGPLNMSGGNTPGSGSANDAHINLLNQGMLTFYTPANEQGGYLRMMDEDKFQIGVYGSGSGYLNFNTDVTFAYNVTIQKTPTEGKDAANKEYVDNAVLEVSGGDAPGHPAPNGIPGRPYAYANEPAGETWDNLKQGTFFVKSNEEVQVAQFDLDGVENSGFPSKDFKAGIRVCFTARNSSGMIVHQMISDHIYAGFETNHRIKYVKDITVKNGRGNGLNAGEVYWITDGFYFF